MDPDKTLTVTIQTPEGIVFALHPAGALTRFLAWLVDACMIVVLSSAASHLLGVLSLIDPDISQAAGILAYFMISMGYGMLLEWYWRGQTPGKRLLRLRVMDSQGLRLQFSQVVVRNLLRFVDALPLFYLVGGVFTLVTRRAQRLGDLAANTMVVCQPRISEPDLNQILGDKFNSLHIHPQLVIRLRRHISPGETDIAFRAVMRRDELEPAARVRLFRQIAEHFKSIVEIPEQLLEGMSDERLVRNVVDILLRPAGSNSAAPRTVSGEKPASS